MLTILAILLNAPNDLHRRGSLYCRSCQVHDLVSLLIVEGEVIGGEGLDDLSSRWVSVIIAGGLLGLSVLTRARANITGQYKQLEEEVIKRVGRLAGRSFCMKLGEYSVIQWRALGRDILFSTPVVHQNRRNVTCLGPSNRKRKTPLLKEGINRVTISSSSLGANCLDILKVGA